MASGAQPCSGTPKIHEAAAGSIDLRRTAEFWEGEREQAAASHRGTSPEMLPRQTPIIIPRD